MKQAVPRIRRSTLDRLYSQAQSSIKNQSNTRLVEIQQWRFRQLWDDCQRHQQRKDEAKQHMEALYSELCQFDPQLPQQQPEVITTFIWRASLLKLAPSVILRLCENSCVMQA